MNFAWQRSEGGIHASGIAQNVRGGNHKLLPGDQIDWFAAGQHAGANFWALQIGEDGNGFALFQGGSAQQGDIGGVIFVLAM